MNRQQWERERIQHEQLSAEESRRVRDLIGRKHEFLVRLGRPIVSQSNTFYIDLDVEADGKPGFGSLLSIGAVTPEGATFYRELKPASNDYVPGMRKFCEDHGLERERLMDEGHEPSEAIYELDIWVREQARNRQSALTAFNAGFDHGWIDLEMLRAGVNDNPFGVVGYCLKSLAMSLGVLQARGECQPSYEWRETAKSELPPEVVPQREFTHNALDDARWQQELHYALVGLIAPDKTIEERVYYNLDCNEEAQYRGELPMHKTTRYADIR